MIKESNFEERYILNDNGHDYWFIVKMPTGTYWTGHYEPRGIRCSREFSRLALAQKHIYQNCRR